MGLRSRRELLRSVSSRYQVADRKNKQRILDEFVAATGYHRKYAVTILVQAAEPSDAVERKPRARPRRYTEIVKEALVVVWRAANRLCSKRLVPFLPEFVSVLEKHGHLSLTTEVKEKLLQISPATMDRLLVDVRRPGQRGLGTTRPGALLKHQIPIRTFADWDDLKPGFLEVDLVAHCGVSTGGAYLSTFTLTDVATGWTECLALLRHDQEEVLRALKEARDLIPFPLLGLDTDNGTEFINYELLSFCREQQLTFTRSRPYKKNDQCHVEQKNGSVVRRIVGYDRYEGNATGQQLAALYGVLRLYVNFFQPSLKLISKHREGSKVTKKYDRAQTPYQRVLASDDVSSEVKAQLQAQYQQLDPVALLRQLECYQDSLWQYAWRQPEIAPETPVETTPLHCEQQTPVVPTEPAPAVPQTNSSESRQRFWRRSSKPNKHHLVKHTWRTRTDPFVLVWDEVERKLEEAPDRCVKELFRNLQRDYPGQFSDGQLRTLQRRAKEWRAKRSVPCPMIVHPEAMVTEGLTVQSGTLASEAIEQNTML